MKLIEEKRICNVIVGITDFTLNLVSIFLSVIHGLSPTAAVQSVSTARRRSQFLQLSADISKMGEGDIVVAEMGCFPLGRRSQYKLRPVTENRDSCPRPHG